MKANLKRSKKYKINLRDILKGLFIAVLTPVLFTIQQSLDAGEINLNWKGIAIAAVSGGVAYLIKNFFEDNKTDKTADTDS